MTTSQNRDFMLKKETRSHYLPSWWIKTASICMRKILIVTLLFSLIGTHAYAQQVIQLCVKVTTNGVTTCVPVSTSNAFPVKSQ